MSDTDDIEPRKSRKKFFVLFLLLIVLILAAAGYGAYAYLQHIWPFEEPQPVATPTQVAGEAAPAQAVDLSDQYIRFDSAFTFNLPGATKRGHMVQIEVVLVVYGAQNAALAQQHLPLISATISEICAQQDFESLASPSGRQRFKRLLLDGIRTKLTGVVNEPLVEQVLFTNFVMQ